MELEMRARIIKTMLGKSADNPEKGLEEKIKQEYILDSDENSANLNKSVIKKEPVRLMDIVIKQEKQESSDEPEVIGVEVVSSLIDKKSSNRRESHRVSTKSKRSKKSQRSRSRSISFEDIPLSNDRKKKKKKITKKEFEERMKNAKKNRQYRKRKNSDEELLATSKNKREIVKEKEIIPDNYQVSKSNKENQIESEKEEGELDSNEDEEGVCSPTDISSDENYSDFSNKSTQRTRGTVRYGRTKKRSRSYNSFSSSSFSSRSRSRSRSIDRKRQNFYSRSNSRSYSRSKSRSPQKIISNLKKLRDKVSSVNNSGKSSTNKEYRNDEDLIKSQTMSKEVIEEEDNWGQKHDIEFVDSDEDFDDKFTNNTHAQSQLVLKKKEDRTAISFSIQKKVGPIKSNLMLTDDPNSYKKIESKHSDEDLDLPSINAPAISEKVTIPQNLVSIEQHENKIDDEEIMITEVCDNSSKVVIAEEILLDDDFIESPVEKLKSPENQESSDLPDKCTYEVITDPVKNLHEVIESVTTKIKNSESNTEVLPVSTNDNILSNNESCNIKPDEKYSSDQLLYEINENKDNLECTQYFPLKVNDKQKIEELEVLESVKCDENESINTNNDFSFDKTISKKLAKTRASSKKYSVPVSTRRTRQSKIIKEIDKPDIEIKIKNAPKTKKKNSPVVPIKRPRRSSRRIEQSTSTDSDLNKDNSLDSQLDTKNEIDINIISLESTEESQCESLAMNEIYAITHKSEYIDDSKEERKSVEVDCADTLLKLANSLVDENSDSSLHNISKKLDDPSKLLHVKKRLSTHSNSDNSDIDVENVCEKETFETAVHMIESVNALPKESKEIEVIVEPIQRTVLKSHKPPKKSWLDSERRKNEQSFIVSDQTENNDSLKPFEIIEPEVVLTDQLNNSNNTDKPDENDDDDDDDDYKNYDPSSVDKLASVEIKGTEIIGEIEPKSSSNNPDFDENEYSTSSWSMRWLQSEKVQKVVNSSKMLSRVRKKIQDKEKIIKSRQIQNPISKETETIPEKSKSSSVIGSIEEYETLFSVKVDEAKQNKVSSNEKSYTKGNVHPLGSDDSDEDSEEEALWSKIMRK